MEGSAAAARKSAGRGQSIWTGHKRAIPVGSCTAAVVQELWRRVAAPAAHCGHARSRVQVCLFHLVLHRPKFLNCHIYASRKVYLSKVHTRHWQGRPNCEEGVPVMVERSRTHFKMAGSSCVLIQSCPCCRHNLTAHYLSCCLVVSSRKQDGAPMPVVRLDGMRERLWV